jgi:hypothetical protein
VRAICSLVAAVGAGAAVDILVVEAGVEVILAVAVEEAVTQAEVAVVAVPVAAVEVVRLTSAVEVVRLTSAVEVVRLTSVVEAVRPALEAEVVVFLTLAEAGESMRRPVEEAQSGNREVGSLCTSIVRPRSLSQMSADSHTRHARSNPQTIWEREHIRERVRVREEFSQAESDPETFSTADSPEPRINPASTSVTVRTAMWRMRQEHELN